MKRNIKNLSIIFFIASAIVSCKKKEKAADTCINNGYFKFLKIGNKRTFDDLSSSGFTETITNYATNGTYTIEHVDGFSRTLFSNKECNDWLLSDASSTILSDSKKYYMPAKRKIGLKWTFESTDEISTTYEVLDTNILVNTKAGNFVCDKIVFKHSNESYSDTLYFSNQYGKIKRDGRYVYSLIGINY